MDDAKEVVSFKNVVLEVNLFRFSYFMLGLFCCFYDFFWYTVVETSSILILLVGALMIHKL